ncbi:hypothetical protein SK128_003545 [Halocaridina rubra]|uniref:Major facilitator superfamily (MFS) profile domain-containing protein n=1 Tax=Halocaridina rubra TaxID=373956 RepID=A0AAN8XIX0_HALRR
MVMAQTEKKDVEDVGLTNDTNDDKQSPSRTLHDTQLLNTGNDEKGLTKLSAFERVLESVGTEGRYQMLLLFAFMIPLSFYCPYGASSLLLLLSTPDHKCHVPGRPSSISQEEWDNLTIPWEKGADGKPRLSQCKMYTIIQANENTTSSPPYEINDIATDCTMGWVYRNDSWKETAVGHYNWVCDEQHVVTTIFSVAILGNAIGTLVLSIVADRIGRRPIFFLTVMINCFFGIINMYMPNWQLFASARFLSATAFFSIYQMPYIIVVELSSEKVRGWTAAFSFVLGTIGMCSVALVAWLFGHWRYFGIFCHAPSILFLLYWKFLPESPRWLLSMNRINECEVIMMRVAKINGRSRPDDLTEMLMEARAQEKKSASIQDLLKHRTLRKHLFIASLNTIIFCVVYSGITLNIRNMTGSEFVNFFVLSLVEIPGNLLGMVSAQFLGRRLTTIYALTLCAIFSVAATAFITDQWMLTTFCGLVKAFVTEAVLVVYMQIGELFPTPLRSISYGFTAVVGLSGAVLVPTLMATGTSDRKLPYYILAGLCLLGAFVSIFLPETLGLPLPQTVLEASQIGQDQTTCSFVTHWTKHKYLAAAEPVRQNAKISNSQSTETVSLHDEKHNGSFS